MKKISWFFCLISGVASLWIIRNKLTAFLNWRRRDTFTGNGTLLSFSHSDKSALLIGSTKTFPHLENQRHEFRR